MHGEMEYYYRGNAKTVTSDKQSMALTVTGQGQVSKQYAAIVLHASLQAQTPPKAIEYGEPQEEDTGSLLPNDMKETWAECTQKLQKVSKAMDDLSNEAQTIQGHWLPSLTWQASSRLLSNTCFCSSPKKSRP